VRYYAIKKAILDLPNERSSHTTPTPRGGGVAIIISFYIGLFFFKEQISLELFLALFAGLPIAIISLLDDLLRLSSKVRLFVQAISAILALYLLGGVNHLDFGIVEFSGVWLNVFAFFIIVWLTNLYNFLDGIDGYAASQTVTLGIGLSLLLFNPLGYVLVTISLGFLLFNWHKASIFMGDVGSASLGFIIAIILFSESSGENIYFWLIALSLFWIDASITLVRRFINGEKVMEAHKKHAFQRLVQSGFSHTLVTVGLIAFNSLFLLLMYFFDWKVVFLVNILCLIVILFWVEKRKQFSDV
jgi:Fuc2NAc and GlcNAc transferase